MTAADPDRAALLAAIRLAPDDDLPRLVYADWLDERGEGERARFIRYQLDRDLHGDDYPIEHHAEYPREADCWPFEDWPDSLTRICRLGPTNPAIAYPLSGYAVTWRRGFIAEVILPAAAFRRHAADLFAAHPVEYVALSGKCAVGDGEHGYHWIRVSRGESSLTWEVPADLWDDSLADGHATAEDAEEALSRVLVARGRRLAGCIPECNPNGS